MNAQPNTSFLFTSFEWPQIGILDLLTIGSSYLLTCKCVFSYTALKMHLRAAFYLPKGGEQRTK